MNKPETDETPQKAGCSSANCSALADLLANLDEWAEHFRQERHGAVLTILRAKKTISDQASRIGELLGAIEQLSSAGGRAERDANGDPADFGGRNAKGDSQSPDQKS